MKNLKNCIIIYIYIYIMTAFGITSLNAQNSVDTICWLWVKDTTMYELADSKHSANQELSSWLTKHGIHTFKKAYPFARTRELHKIHELVAHQPFNIDTLFRELNSQFGNKFYNLLKPSRSDTVMVYDPTDWMWVAHANDWLWHLKKIEADHAWDITRGNPDVKIAVIDIGIDNQHPDLITEILYPYDPVSLDPFHCEYLDGHGTTVAGFASGETAETGQTPNGIYASVGFKTKIIAYFSPMERVDFLNKALHASTVMGADVLVSCANGGIDTIPHPESGEELIVREILDNGTVIVVPAGNGLGGHNNSNSSGGYLPFYPFHPSYDDRVIIVSSTGIDDKHYYFNSSPNHLKEETHSHFPEVDLCAPGYELMGAAQTHCSNTTWPFWHAYSGTSFSSPIVAGAVSLIKSIDKNFTPGEIEYFLKSTTDPIVDAANYPGMVGTGRLNIFKALQKAVNCAPIVITGNETWLNDDAIICGLEIESGAKLTVKGTLKVSDRCRIIVKRGGELCIDGGKITNLDRGRYWRGIEVWGNSSLPQIPLSNQGVIRIINGGTIENAICGINTTRIPDDENSIPMENYSGGIIIAINANFINNKTAIQIQPYSQSSLSSFTNCTFQTTASYSYNSLPDYFVKLTGITNVKFNGCIFENATGPGNITQPENLGSGIYAINSDILIGPTCLQNICPCPENSYKHSTFNNLYRGVYALSTGPARVVSIDRADFKLNYRGLYLGALNYATLTRNYIKPFPERETSTPKTYGFYLDQCTGYHIEANTFNSENTTQKGLGLIINKSGPDNNLVYNNLFKNLWIATMAQDENKGSTTTGLCYKCNDFTNNSYDILVTVSGSLNPNSGIAYNQGSNTAPAGNSFTVTGAAVYNFANQAHPVNYFHHASSPYPEVKLIPYPRLNVTPIQAPGTSYNKEISCPSTLDGSGLPEDKYEMEIAAETASLIEDSLNLLVDGGNTEALLANVQSSFPEQAVDLYQDLIALSPYLSDSVIKQAIEKEEVINNPMIRDIMVANSQSAKSDELLNALENRIEPLPEAMWNEILSGDTLVSAKEIMESELALWLQKKDQHFNNIVRYYLTDSIGGIDNDSIIEFLNDVNTYESQRQRAILQATEGAFVQALATLDALNANMAINTLQTDDINGLRVLISALDSLFVNPFKLSKSDSVLLNLLVEISVSVSSQPAAFARNLLIDKSWTIYDEPILMPNMQKSGKRIKIGTSLLSNQPRDKTLKVFPNPAHNYFLVETGYISAKQEIRITNIEGRTLIRQKTSANRLTFIDCKALKPGIYLVQLFESNRLISSAKLTLN